MSLIGAFLDGVPKLENQGLLLVDLIPSRMGCSFIAFVLGRFHEWASAAWEMQKERLVVRSKKEEETFDVRFIATYHEEDYDMMTAMQETLTGRIMNQWWDKCPEAGDPARPNVSFDVEQPAMKVLTIQDGQVRQLAIIYELTLRLPDLVVQKYQGVQCDTMKTLMDKLHADSVIAKVVKARCGASSPSAGANSGKNRTVATPDWSGEQAPNFNQRLSAENCIPISDFESRRQLGPQPCACINMETSGSWRKHLFNESPRWRWSCVRIILRGS